MTQTALVKLSEIKEPKITLIAGTEDKVCPYKIANETIRVDLGDTIGDFIPLDGKNHMYFASATDDDFIGNLTAQLVASNAITGIAFAFTSFILSALMLS